MGGILLLLGGKGTEIRQERRRGAVSTGAIFRCSPGAAGFFEAFRDGQEKFFFKRPADHLHANG
jgi:hypothetical protein